MLFILVATFLNWFVLIILMIHPFFKLGTDLLEYRLFERDIFSRDALVKGFETEAKIQGYDFLIDSSVFKDFTHYILYRAPVEGIVTLRNNYNVVLEQLGDLWARRQMEQPGGAFYDDEMGDEISIVPMDRLSDFILKGNGGKFLASQYEDCSSGNYVFSNGRQVPIELLRAYKEESFGYSETSLGFDDLDFN